MDTIYLDELTERVDAAMDAANNAAHFAKLSEVAAEIERNAGVDGKLTRADAVDLLASISDFLAGHDATRANDVYCAALRVMSYLDQLAARSDAAMKETDLATLKEIAGEIERNAGVDSRLTRADAVELLDAIADFLARHDATRAIEVHCTALRVLAGSPAVDMSLTENHLATISALFERKGDLAGALEMQRLLLSITRNHAGIGSATLSWRITDSLELLKRARIAAEAAKDDELARELSLEEERLSEEKQILDRKYGAGGAIIQQSAMAETNEEYRAAMPKTHDLLGVYYCTTRKRSDKRAPYGFYMSQRSNDISPTSEHGIAKVWVPRDRESGSLDEPSRSTVAWLPHYRPTPRKRRGLYLLDEVVPSDGAEAWSKAVAELAAERRKASPREKHELLVYIHGFNTRFWEAMTRAAQLGADLNVRGTVAAYSWPSQGYAWPGYYYRYDETEVSDVNTTHLADMLQRLSESLTDDRGPPEMTIVAHSLGNRLLLRALEQLPPAWKVSGATIKRIRHVIFASPDVEIGDFAGRVKRLVDVADRMTVYCSTRDRALQLGEKFLTRYKRAGRSARTLAPLLAEANIDVVDTSRIKADLLGHNDYSSVATDDLRMAMWLECPAKQRCRLLEQKYAAAQTAYWSHKWINGVHEKADANGDPTVKWAVRKALSLVRLQPGNPREKIVRALVQANKERKIAIAPPLPAGDAVGTAISLACWDAAIHELEAMKLQARSD